MFRSKLLDHTSDLDDLELILSSHSFNMVHLFRPLTGLKSRISLHDHVTGLASNPVLNVLLCHLS
jgi:hypothetical protein